MKIKSELNLSRKRKYFFSLGVAVICAGSVGANAQSSIADCAEVENTAERLVCYDRVAESTQNLPVVRLPRNSRSTTTQIADDTTAAESVSQQDEFGLDINRDDEEERRVERQRAREARENEPRVRTYVVASAKHNDFTGWTIEFADGGTWKQSGTDDYKINVGERYTIRRSAFGAYLLSNSQNNRKMKVTRVK